MGTALTYARRYALFTLVGIAGEDDLDAPDLQTPSSQTASATRQNGKGNGIKHTANGKIVSSDDSVAGANSPAPYRRGRQRRPHGDGTPARILPPDQSAALRDRLVGELNHLGCADDAAHWARRSLPEKASLTAADAQSVEQAFQAKLGTFAGDFDKPSDLLPRPPLDPGSERRPSEIEAPGIASTSAGIDKSVLMLPEPRRLRDKEHIRYVAKQPCLVCGRRPADAHHLRFAQRTALGRKVSDEFTVPLCRGHHRELHRCGDEAAWWSKVGIDPRLPARKLWLHSHPLPTHLAEQRQTAPQEKSRRLSLANTSMAEDPVGPMSKLQNEPSRRDKSL
jgi:hypothetical protein